VDLGNPQKQYGQDGIVRTETPLPQRQRPLADRHRLVVLAGLSEGHRLFVEQIDLRAHVERNGDRPFPVGAHHAQPHRCASTLVLQRLSQEMVILNVDTIEGQDHLARLKPRCRSRRSGDGVDDLGAARRL
jgi:hypothetical protein